LALVVLGMSTSAHATTQVLLLVRPQHLKDWIPLKIWMNIKKDIEVSTFISESSIQKSSHAN